MSAQPNAPLLPGIAAIQRLVAADMAQVDALIRHRLDSDVALIKQISEHLVTAGGKRLRPAVTLLTARALEFEGTRHHQLAAIVEFIHTSTLLHDDVVDESSLRRGRETANAVWGNAPSVLVGDFLYSRSFQLMVELDSMPIMRILADATNQIAEGEVLQLLHVRNPDTDEAAYLRVVERKTAVLFSAAARLGALIAGANEAEQRRWADYGLNLGMAFQIADDVLDYTADPQALGKNLGDDLAEGKATLPLIYALAQAAPDTRIRLADIVREGRVDALPEILAAIERSGSLRRSRAMAVRYAEAAEACLAGLPQNDRMLCLRGLARYAVERSH